MLNLSFLSLAALLALPSLFTIAQDSKPAMVRTANLVANADFMARDPQQRPLRWIMGKGLQSATISSEQRHGGQKDDHCLKVLDTSTSEGILIRSEKRIANPGTRYIAEAWTKGRHGKVPPFYLEFWDQNNARIGQQSVAPERDTSWHKYVAVLQAPDKTTHVTVSISSGQGDTSLSYWDDISLVYEIPYTQNLKKGVRELFIDDHRIESMVDAQRLVHPGKKSKPVITATEPWEGNSTYIYGTVLKDQPRGSGYRMWYTAYLDEKYFLCYATSKDGVHWVKPKLGVFEFKGSKQNNICREGGGTLVYDPHEKDSSRRYKLMAFEAGQRFGYGVHFSPDGFRWTAYTGNPVLAYGDVSNVTYDEKKRLFIASTKQRMLVSNTGVTPNKMDRAAFISTSTDFVNWTAPDAPGSSWTLAVEGDYSDDFGVMSKGGLEGQIYGMTVYPYEEQYIGMPWCFDINTYNNGVFAVTGDGPIRPQLAVSRDLKHWSRLNRDPVLPLGKAGAWDDGTLYTASTLHVSEKMIGLYFGAMNLPHGGNSKTQTQMARIGIATWRRDGFVSLYNSGDDPGIITTKDIVFEGSKLHVNAHLAPGGSLKVEILDESGNPVPGYALPDARGITGDQLSATLSWKERSDISKLAGKPVKLRFHLLDGDLYSYWFTD